MSGAPVSTGCAQPTGITVGHWSVGGVGLRDPGHFVDRPIALCWKSWNPAVDPGNEERLGTNRNGVLLGTPGTAQKWVAAELEQMAAAIDNFLRSNGLQQQLAQKGPQRAAEFSWTLTSAELKQRLPITWSR